MPSSMQCTRMESRMLTTVNKTYKFSLLWDDLDISFLCACAQRSMMSRYIYATGPISFTNCVEVLVLTSVNFDFVYLFVCFTSILLSDSLSYLSNFRFFDMTSTLSTMRSIENYVVLLGQWIIIWNVEWRKISFCCIFVVGSRGVHLFGCIIMWTEHLLLWIWMFSFVVSFPITSHDYNISNGCHCCGAYLCGLCWMQPNNASEK